MTHIQAGPGAFRFFVPVHLEGTANARGAARSGWALSRRARLHKEATYAAALTAARGARAPRGVEAWPTARPKRVAFLALLHNHVDDDHLPFLLKHVRDGLKGAKLIHDDSKRSGHVFVYDQAIDRRRRGVEITVELLEGGPA